MSVPRIVEPSLPVFVTRRTVCRFYLLRPDRELTEGFLYCLATAAEDRSGVTVSHVSVRGVAGELGLAKDTVARALRRLAAQRLVIYVPARNQDGRFGSSHYRLTIPPAVLIRAVVPPSSEALRAKPSRPARPSLPAQLSLLEAPSLGF